MKIGKISVINQGHASSQTIMNKSTDKNTTWPGGYQGGERVYFERGSTEIGVVEPFFQNKTSKPGTVLVKTGSGELKWVDEEHLVPTE